MRGGGRAGAGQAPVRPREGAQASGFLKAASATAGLNPTEPHRGGAAGEVGAAGRRQS